MKDSHKEIHKEPPNSKFSLCLFLDVLKIGISKALVFPSSFSFLVCRTIHQIYKCCCSRLSVNFEPLFLHFADLVVGSVVCNVNEAAEENLKSRTHQNIRGH